MKPFKTLFILFTAAAVATLSNCYDRHECPETKGKNVTVYIDNAFLKAYPYNLEGYDTLTFKNTKGETAVLYGTVEKFWRHVSYPDEYTDPGCAVDDRYKLEINSHVFTGNHPDLDRIVVNLYVQYIRNVSYIPDPRDVTYYEFSFNGREFIQSYAINFNGEDLYTTNVEIDGKNYSGWLYGNENDTLVFNKYNGILKIKTANDIWLNANP